ncbi:hypothetical protein [Aquabacterium humicola]|uniref:hypothetical protein n=1 Tax=Aquabacterium humicola TaxID=3237377 RepID=UPI00254345B5|nr:hypothetical protein [Rubrivivax pictus]
MIGGRGVTAGLPVDAAALGAHRPAVARAGFVRTLVRAHWRGELALGTSLGGCCALVGGLAALVAAALAGWPDVATVASPRWPALALLSGWPLALLVQSWGIAGAWRSATRTALDDPRLRRATFAARLVIASWALVLLASTALHFVPRLPSLLSLAIGRDPAGPISVSASPDGRRVRLQGPLSAGAAEQVQRVLEVTPQARLLELDVPGGRLHDALQIAALIRDRGWTTRITGHCIDACVPVFLAGALRQALPEAQLAIRRPPPAAFNPLLRQLIRRRLAVLHEQAGLPAAFVRKSLAMPIGTPWRAGREELSEMGALHGPRHPLDVDVPMPRAATVADVADALRSGLVWPLLERRVPGLIDAAAARWLAARDAGLQGDALMEATQAGIDELIPRLLGQSGPALREQYVELLAQQIAAAGELGFTGCGQLLSGAATARRAMPRELAVREAAWLVDASAEPDMQAARGPTALEAEVVRRTLGPRAPGQLLALRHPGEVGWPHCERAAALIAEVMKLPPPERRLAIRLIAARS